MNNSSQSFFNSEHERQLQSTLDFIAYSTNLPVRIADLNSPLITNEINRLALVSSSSEQKAGFNATEQLHSIFEKIHSIKAQAPAILDGLYNPITFNFKSLPSPLQRLSKFNDVVHTKSTNSYAFNEAERLLDDAERDLWLTETSNPLAVNDLFRLSPEWRWFELLWFTKTLKEFKNGRDFIQDKITDAYDLQGWKYFFMPCCDNKIIVVGPIYNVTKPKSTYKFNDTYGRDILSFFSSFYHLYGRWSQNSRFSKEDMERMLNTRLPLSDKSVKRRMRYVLRGLLTSKMLFEENLNSVNSDLILSSRFMGQFARVAVSVDRIVSTIGDMDCVGNENKDTDLENVQRKTNEYEFSIPISINLENICCAKLKFVRVDNESNNALSDCECKKVELIGYKNSFKKNEKHKLSILLNNKPIIDTVKLDEISDKLDRWWESARARKKYLEATRVRLSADWMNHQYLVASGKSIDANTFLSTQTKNEYNRSVDYDLICKLVLNTLRCDLCNIYRYYPHDDTEMLSVLGMASGKNIWSHEELNEIARHMDNVSSDQNKNIISKAESSLVFKCISTHSTEYYTDPAFTDYHRNASKNHGNLTWPQEILKPNRVVATPILVEGRVWGVIEVATLAPDGIDNSSRFELNSFSSILSSYLFNITLTRNLKTMGTDSRKWVLNPSSAISNIADGLAKNICKVSLARAAVIYIQVSDSDKSLYKIVGSAGPNFYKEKKHNLQLDLRDIEDSKLLLGQIWRRYIEDGETHVTARIAEGENNHRVEDNPEYFVLGNEYGNISTPGSIFKELVIDGVSQVNAFIFDIDVFKQLPSNQVPFNIPDITPRNPTGMVVVYHHQFNNRHHWVEVNEMIANRLAQTFDELLVGRRKRVQRGKIVRHELKHTVRALSSAARNLQGDARYIKKTFNDINRLSRNAKLNNVSTDELLDGLKILANRENQSRIDRLTKLADNWLDVYDQLDTQTESIERIDDIEFDNFVDRIYSSKSRVRELKPYSSLKRSILDALSQYKKPLLDKGLFLNHASISDNLYIRIKPEIMALLLRNVLDNWGKYASPDRTLEIKLSPVYERSSKPITYQLQFKNSAIVSGSNSSVQKWFDFEVRGAPAQIAGIDGDGIGLYWIKYILSQKYDIDCELTIEPLGNVKNKSMIVLTWMLPSKWLTMNPEIYVSE